jgi:hypothetical protein
VRQEDECIALNRRGQHCKWFVKGKCSNSSVRLSTYCQCLNLTERQYRALEKDRKGIEELEQGN